MTVGTMMRRNRSTGSASSDHRDVGSGGDSLEVGASAKRRDRVHQQILIGRFFLEQVVVGHRR